MTQIRPRPRCPTCHRAPSERSVGLLKPPEGILGVHIEVDTCTDPVHDRADRIEDYDLMLRAAMEVLPGICMESFDTGPAIVAETTPSDWDTIHRLQADDRGIPILTAEAREDLKKKWPPD